MTQNYGPRMTAVFQYDLRKFDGNPHTAETPFGKPVALCLGDELASPLREAAPDMLEALRGLQQFFALTDECSTGRFDRLAEQYRRETGKWAPGKSIPDAYNDSTDCETRRKEYDEWVQSKVAEARAAIAKATGDAQ